MELLPGARGSSLVGIDPPGSQTIRVVHRFCVLDPGISAPEGPRPEEK